MTSTIAPPAWEVTRYTFTGTLALTGALHIGSGGGGIIGTGEALTDATVIRDSAGRPYIPGSSLRGVLRTAISQYAPLLFVPRPAEPPAAESSRFDPQRDWAVIRDDETIQQVLDPVIEPLREEGAIQQALDQHLTAAERLFGTVYWASPLLIPDLHLREEQAGGGEIRHGVGIDRDTGAARDEVKYDFEVLPRGLAFDLWLRCEVPPHPAHYRRVWPWLLALGLHLLEQGELRLGGRVARGVGQVHLVDLQVAMLEMGDRAALLRTLLAETEAVRAGTLQTMWMERMLKEIEDVCTTTQ